MSSKDYLEQVKATYLEQWPAALHRLSIVSLGVQLSLEEAAALGKSIMDFGPGFDRWPGEPALLDSVRANLRELVSRHPKGAFLRLGSRSPKDSWLGHRTGFKVTAEDADPLRFFADTSERTADDLHLALAAGYRPWIWVREWVDIPEWAEFRCFMKGRELVGVSQYNYFDFCPEIARQASLIEWGARTFFDQRFRAASHLDDVVFDVFVKTGGPEGDRWVEAKLLEINPFTEQTDPCLFSWIGGGDFDGSFRFKKEPDAPRSSILVKKGEDHDI